MDGKRRKREGGRRGGRAIDRRHVSWHNLARSVSGVREESRQERECTWPACVPARYTREWPANLRASQQLARSLVRPPARLTDRPACVHLYNARLLRERSTAATAAAVAALGVNHERERVRPVSYIVTYVSSRFRAFIPPRRDPYKRRAAVVKSRRTERRRESRQQQVAYRAFRPRTLRASACSEFSAPRSSLRRNRKWSSDVEKYCFPF